MVFLYFWNFFAIFFFNFQLRVWMERNVKIIFIFSLSHPFPSNFGLKCSHNGIVLYFEFFFYIFLNFVFRVGLGVKQNDNFCFAIFLEFSITSRVGTYLNDFFFSLSRPSPTYFGLERSNNGVF